MRKAVYYLTIILTLQMLSCEQNAASVAHDERVPNNQKAWAWLDFQRPERVNPVISPDTNVVFYCPMRSEAVKWQESDTFNPAAAVKDGKIVVLFRSEDNSAVGIGTFIVIMLIDILVFTTIF